MNHLIRKGLGVMKVKKINVCIDDEWILCDIKNNSNTENLTKNNTDTLIYDNLPNKLDTYSNTPNIRYITNQSDIPNNRLINNNYNHLPLKTSLLPIINENHSFISMCYDLFTNIIEEIELLKALFLFDVIEISFLSV